MTKSDYYKYLEELPNYEDEYNKLFENPEHYVPLDKALEYIVKQHIPISIFTYDYKSKNFDIDNEMLIDDLIADLEVAKKNNYTQICFEGGVEGEEVFAHVEARVPKENSEIAKRLLKSIRYTVETDKLYLCYRIEQLEKQLENTYKNE